MLQKAMSFALCIQLFFLYGFADEYWSDPVTVSEIVPDVDNHCHLTMNDRGDALLVWIADGQLYSSEFNHGTMIWTSPLSESLSNFGELFSSPKAALNEEGKAAVVLVAQDTRQLVFLSKSLGDSWTTLSPISVNSDNISYNIAFERNDAKILVLSHFNDETFQMHLVTLKDEWRRIQEINYLATFNYLKTRDNLVKLINTSKSARVDAACFSPFVNALLPERFSDIALTSHPEYAKASSNRVVGIWKEHNTLFRGCAKKPYRLEDLSISIFQSDSDSSSITPCNIGINIDNGYTTALWSRVAASDSSYTLFSQSLMPESNTWTDTAELLAPTTDSIRNVGVIVDAVCASVAIWENQHTNSVNYSIKATDSWSTPTVLATNAKNPLIAASSNGTNGYNLAVWVEGDRIASAAHLVYTRPAAPSNFAGTFEIAQVEGVSEVTDILSWSASEFATDYYLYSDSELTRLIGSTSETSFQINNIDLSTNNRYFLVARDADGHASAPTSCSIRYPFVEAQ